MAFRMVVSIYKLVTICNSTQSPVQPQSGHSLGPALLECLCSTGLGFGLKITLGVCVWGGGGGVTFSRSPLNPSERENEAPSVRGDCSRSNSIAEQADSAELKHPGSKRLFRPSESLSKALSDHRF